MVFLVLRLYCDVIVDHFLISFTLLYTELCARQVRNIKVEGFGDGCLKVISFLTLQRVNI